MVIYLVSGDKLTHVATQSEAFALAKAQSLDETFCVDVIRLNVLTDKAAIIRLLNHEGQYASSENVLRSYLRGRKTRAPAG